MKLLTTLILLAIFSSISAHAQSTPFNTDDPAKYGRQLVLHSDEVLKGWIDEVVMGEMRLYDTKGRSVIRSFRRMAYERFGLGDKSILRFTAPADIKGVAALNYENSGRSDDNWLYLPATKKVRRISGANNTASFQGSEFTYEDLNELDPNEYRWRFLEETALDVDGQALPVYKIEGVPTYRDTAYSHLLLYLSKDSWYQVKIEYFDKSGAHLKSRTASKWKAHHDKFWRASQIDMENHLTGKKTILKFSDFYVDLSRYTSKKTQLKRENLREELFTKRSLSK